MARTFSPVVPKKEGTPTWLYNVLRRLADNQLLTNRGIAAVARGESPDGSGNPLVDTTKFFYKPGLPGGQIAYGGSNGGDYLKLRSTAGGPKGKIYLGSQDATVYDDVNDYLGINQTIPAAALHVRGNSTVSPATVARPSTQILNQGCPGTCNWFGEDARTTTLYNSVNDAIDNTSSAGDSTYVEEVLGLSGALQLGIVAVDPGVDTGISFKYRARKTIAGSANLTWTLKQGITTIESWTDTINNTSFDPYTHAFSAINIVNITDWTNLSITVTPGGAAGQQHLISLMYLETVAASGTPVPTVLVDARTSQTTDLQQWRNASSSPVALVSVGGLITLTTSLLMKGATSGIFTQSVAGTVTTYGIVWPSAQGAANSFPKNDGAGNLSWDTTVGSHKLLDGAVNNDTVAHTAVLGDIIAANSTPAWQAVAGNTTSTRKFLRQTGTGAVSALPAWDTIQAADVPASALTELSDTNVILTLSGNPTVALLAATEITVSWSGTLAISRGGTGQSTALAGFNALSPLTTAGDLLTYSGGNNVRLGVGANPNGYVLTLVSGAPAWAAASGGSGPLLDASHNTDTVAHTPVRGDIIVANSTPAWAAVAHGTSKQVVGTDGTDTLFVSLDNTYLPDRTRRILITPQMMIQSNGTAMTHGLIGTYSASIDRWVFVNAPATGPQAVSFSVQLPSDWASGGVTVKIICGPISTNAQDAALVFNVLYKFLNPATPSLYDVASETKISKTFTYQGLTGSGGDFNNPKEVKLITLGTASTNIAADTILRLHVERDSADAADTYTNSWHLYGIVLEYTADM